MKRQRKLSASPVLDRLAGDEAIIVLRKLLKKHEELQQEAEGIAVGLISAQSVEAIAAELSEALTGVDLEALNARAGKHAWGYVESCEAAIELLEEAVEERVEEMSCQWSHNGLPLAGAAGTSLAINDFNATKVNPLHCCPKQAIWDSSDFHFQADVPKTPRVRVPPLSA